MDVEYIKAIKRHLATNSEHWMTAKQISDAIGYPHRKITVTLSHYAQKGLLEKRRINTTGKERMSYRPLPGAFEEPVIVKVEPANYQAWAAMIGKIVRMRPLDFRPYTA